MTASTSGTIRVTLPDGSVREVPAGTTLTAGGRGIGPGLARAAWPPGSNGADRDLDRPLDARHDARDPHREGSATRSTCCGIPRRTSSRPRCASCVPTRRSASDPPIEDGFYYDFEVDRAVHARGPRAFEAEMRKVAAEKYPFVREEVDRAEAQKRFADDPLKLERLERAGRRRDHLDLHRRPVHRPVPRPARARHRRASSTSSCSHGAGAYWRGDDAAPDAPAHLRHRVLQEGGARRATSTGSRRRRSATTACSARSSTSSCSTRSRRAPRSGPSGARSLYNALVGLHARAAARTATSEIKTPLLYNKGLWEMSRPLGQVQREHVPRARQRDAASTTSRSSR